MDASTRADFSGQLDAVIEEARGRVAAFQSEAGIHFTSYHAATTLDHAGTTSYFVSDETRREFEKRHGLTP